jgi:hypothetical protein
MDVGREELQIEMGYRFSVVTRKNVEGRPGRGGFGGFGTGFGLRNSNTTAALNLLCFSEKKNL